MDHLLIASSSRDAKSMRVFEGRRGGRNLEQQWDRGFTIPLRCDQILHVKLVISSVPIRKLVSAPAEIAAAIVSDLDPQLVPPLPR